MTQENQTDKIPIDMYDENGRAIFVGDTVKKYWGMWRQNGVMVAYYRYHKIRKVQLKNVISYFLGTCHNFWEGIDVEVCEKPENELYDTNIHDTEPQSKTGHYKGIVGESSGGF